MGLEGLQTQVVPIALGEGVDTKTDPKQLAPGKLTDLQNGKFQTGREIRKRNGFAALPTLSAGLSVQGYQSELVSLDGTNLYSYNSSGASEVSKGSLPIVNLSTQTVVRTTTQQTIQDSAINGSLKCFVWRDSVGQIGYSVFDSATNQSIVNNRTVDAAGLHAKVLAVGTKFVIIYYSSTAPSLVYKSIDTSTPTTLSGAVTISTDINSSSHLFDASVFNSRIYIAYASQATAVVSTCYLDSSLTLSSKFNFGSTRPTSCLTIVGDASNQAWIAWGDSTNGVIVAVAGANLNSTVLAATALEASASAQLASNITGIVSGTTATFYYQIPGVPIVTGDLMDFIRINTMTLAGSAGASSVFIRGLGLASKVFARTSVNYFMVAHQSILQSSYFLINGSGSMVLKLSPSNGGGYTSFSILPEVNLVSSGVYQTASLVKDRITVSNGTIGTQTGVLSATMSFATKDPSKFILGKELHVCGGALKMYDGANVVEHGFNVYPEGITAAAAVAGGGGLGIGASSTANNQVQYSAVYEWTDNQGQNHRSASSVPTSVALTSLAVATVAGTTPGGTSNQLTSVTAGTMVVGQYVNFIGHSNSGAGKPANSWSYNSTVTVASGTTITLSGSFTIASGVNQFLVSNVPLSLYWMLDPGDQICVNAFPGQILVAAESGGSQFAAGTTSLGPITNSLSTGAHFSTSNPIGSGVGTSVMYYSTDGYSIAVTVPTLKLTDKSKVSLALYRTTVNGTVFYRTTSQTALTYNDPTADTVSITDTTGDGALVGNEQLYTTGGEIENIAPPALSIATTYRSRAVALMPENPLAWTYSKQVIPGSPVEFTDAFRANVDSNIGSITAVGVLDEKIVFFGPNSKYVVSGDGPSPSGANNDFSPAQHITGSTGCSNQASVIEIPSGIIYQDLTKGIYLLDRSLTERYIGQDVEAYNSNVVTSAQTIPGATLVRLTLDSGKALIYDWFYNQWGVDSYPSAAMSSTLFQNIFTYINAAGNVLQESGFTDNGTFIPLSLTTGWMSFAGVEGFQRVRRLLILGNYKSAHTLNVQIYTDFNDTTPSQTVAIPVTSDPGVYQYRIHLLQQKCESIKIKIFDSQTPAYGEGFSLSSLGLEVGIKRGPMKLASGNSY